MAEIFYVGNTEQPREETTFVPLLQFMRHSLTWQILSVEAFYQYHRRPNGSASHVSSTPRLSLQRLTLYVHKLQPRKPPHKKNASRAISMLLGAIVRDGTH
jgi:hypothetical protein